MTGAAVGIGYYLWLQARWALAGIIAYLLMLAAAAQLFPGAREPVLMAALLLMASGAHLLHVFSLGPADFGVRSSGFPKHLFVLPQSTRSLVAWPMMFAAGTNAILWTLAALLVLRPAGFSTPVLWPAAMAAASTVWVQAIGWTPFATPFARVPAVALAAVPLILLGTWCGIHLESAVVTAFASAGSIVWMLCAFAFGVWGVARARGGHEGGWGGVFNYAAAALGRIPFASIRRNRRPFRSAATAQLWHEWRRNGLFLPVMLLIFGVPMLTLSCVTMLNRNHDQSGLMIGTVLIPAVAITVVPWVIIPLLLSLTLGASIGKFDAWGKEEMAPFFATRPMHTSQFVLIKIVSAAISAVIAVSAIIFFLGIWAALEASTFNQHESLVRAAWRDLSPRTIGFGLLGLLILVALMWRSSVNGMWPSLAGRKWTSTVMGLVSFFLLSVAIAAAGWAYRRLDIQALFMSWAPWMVGVLLADKLILATAAILAVHKHGLIRPQMIGVLLGGWMLFAAAIIAILSYWLPLTWVLGAGVLLFLPLARVAISPLALHCNRHR